MFVEDVTNMMPWLLKECSSGIN